MRPSGAGRVAAIIQERRRQGGRNLGATKKECLCLLWVRGADGFGFQSDGNDHDGGRSAVQRCDKRRRKIFVRMYFVVACRSESCILRMRARFTVAPRARIV